MLPVSRQFPAKLPITVIRRMTEHAKWPVIYRNFLSMLMSYRPNCLYFYIANLGIDPSMDLCLDGSKGIDLAKTLQSVIMKQG